jgi:hypothetical protein
MCCVGRGNTELFGHVNLENRRISGIMAVLMTKIGVVSGKIESKVSVPANRSRLVGSFRSCRNYASVVR